MSKAGNWRGEHLEEEGVIERLLGEENALGCIAERGIQYDTEDIIL
jgi:hypothetical protein